MARRPVVWVPPGMPTPLMFGVDARRMGRAPEPGGSRRRTEVWVKAGEGFSAPVERGPRPKDALDRPSPVKPALGRQAPGGGRSFGWNLESAMRRSGEPEGGQSGGEEMFVPPEIEATAHEVMARYAMSVAEMQLITTKPDKGGAIWRIMTDHGPRSLKLLHREVPRSLFSIGAQDYLVAQGARVPALVRTETGENHVVMDERIWIVTDWIEGLTPATKVGLEGAQALCYGLGEFHRLSKGYTAPPGAAPSTRLRKWPRAYQKVLGKIGWFRVLAQAYSEMPASTVLLSVVDRFERQAAQALRQLEQSGYRELVGRGEAFWGIVHQDDCRRGNAAA